MSAALFENRDDFIKLRCVGQDGSEIHYGLSTTTPLKLVKKLYAERKGQPIDAFIMSLNDIVVEEVLKRKSVLLEGNSNRSVSANNARKTAWSSVQQAVITKTGQLKTVEQLKVIWGHRKARLKEDLSTEKRYRNSTGGGVDEAIEHTIANNRDKWSDADNALVRSLGNTPAFHGISAKHETNATSALVGDCFDDDNFGFEHVDNSPSRPIIKRKKINFESEVDTSDDEFVDVKRKSFSTRNFMLEQQKLITQQRLFYEKQNILTSTLLRLAQQQLAYFSQQSSSALTPVHDSFMSQSNVLPGDSNIEESH